MNYVLKLKRFFRGLAEVNPRWGVEGRRGNNKTPLPEGFELVERDNLWIQDGNLQYSDTIVRILNLSPADEKTPYPHVYLYFRIRSQRCGTPGAWEYHKPKITEVRAIYPLVPIMEYL